MESLIYQGSPLADYLEGTASDEGDTDPSASEEPVSPNSEPVSYAPRGTPSDHSSFRKKFLKIRKEHANINVDQLSKLNQKCKQFVANKLAPDNSKFLERFRYILVSSQLLSDHATVQGYNPRLSLQNATLQTETIDWGGPSLTPKGAGLTATATFLMAWLIHWARSLARDQSSWYRVCIFAATATILAGVAYLFFRWQRRAMTKRRAVEEVSSMVSAAQELDASTAGAISLVQEVELVSRGYRISSPLPPISRMEDYGQVKRCERLRRALRQNLDAIITPYAKAYNHFRNSVVEIDLERYNDIYEITRMDIEEVEALAHEGTEEFSDPEALKSLKTSLQRLHTSRKLFICCLLTIPFTHRTQSIALWRTISNSMCELATISMAATTNLDSILSEQAELSGPLTPLKVPLTPGRERLQVQTRKFAYLAQGTRELQAKLYLLREDCDRALSAPTDETDSSDVSGKLLEQYDAFGVDLRSLLQEWEHGRKALVTALDRQADRRASLASTTSLTHSRSTTPSSLGGFTAIGSGSPADALKILNGETLPPIEAQSSDDEIYEAVAVPRPRSVLTRDERIKKLHEERVKQAERKEKADESRRMVKELESVIKLRPITKDKRRRITSM